jgi:hypothetical protein
MTKKVKKWGKSKWCMDGKDCGWCANRSPEECHCTCKCHKKGRMYTVEAVLRSLILEVDPKLSNLRIGQLIDKYKHKVVQADLDSRREFVNG